MNLADNLSGLENLIGNSPLYKCTGPGAVYAKLEYHNLMGSIKDRPALYILKNAIARGLVGPESTVIESTSGNFGIALAGICNRLGLKFIPVVDPNITEEKAAVLRMLSWKVVKVEERDETGGFLLNRIREVQRLVKTVPGAFNPNQYENDDNYLCYYHTLGREINNNFGRLDHVFVSVSSGGTITGLSMRLKEKFPRLKIIAVDVEGSLIFSDKPAVRRLSGLGSSMRTAMIDKALIDEAMVLSQWDIVQGCHSLLKEQNILGGASAGAVFRAMQLFNEKYHINNGGNINLLIIPDNGSAYMNSIYNETWVKANIQNIHHEVHK
ncbi:cysteine synthase A [Chitinophaga eiseniae]|uniref:Cysteine synthase A n=1 Tax=Chitinophaga eiseniae TaxID=634771 RepID=A0A1T4TWI6_9BACT|nr:pyridoxal-phosphate dependent enzyme [Chitinophaga eiseniae]SKA44793.1 cysteine synthase A [Chitinophaga eiseniae]